MWTRSWLVAGALLKHVVLFRAWGKNKFCALCDEDMQAKSSNVSDAELTRSFGRYARSHNQY